jgi:hypothetical protein
MPRIDLRWLSVLALMAATSGACLTATEPMQDYRTVQGTAHLDTGGGIWLSFSGPCRASEQPCRRPESRYYLPGDEGYEQVAQALGPMRVARLKRFWPCWDDAPGEDHRACVPIRYPGHVFPNGNQFH